MSSSSLYRFASSSSSSCRPATSRLASKNGHHQCRSYHPAVMATTQWSTRYDDSGSPLTGKTSRDDALMKRSFNGASLLNPSRRSSLSTQPPRAIVSDRGTATIQFVSNVQRQTFAASASDTGGGYVRWYVSRAHPKPIPTYNVHDAVSMILQGCEERAIHRQKRWERNAPKRKAKAEADGKPWNEEEDKKYRTQDETIEFAARLGLDPRKPNQMLRGSVVLPHGTGKPVKVVAFTSDQSSQEAATKAGANLVGGEELVEAIRSGETVIADYDRAVASQEMLSKLSAIGRVLGPRGLMPNMKLGTVGAPDEMPDLVKRQMSGLLNYRLNKDGSFHAPIGKASMGKRKILDHVKTVMNEIIDKKPEGAKGVYLRNVTLSSQQGKGVRCDMKTVNPGSPFFMMEPDDNDSGRSEQAAA